MIRVVRLGTRRAAGEGPRLGTVRRPPRGVPKARFARDDWYDLWLPDLAPSEALVKRGLRAKTPADWKAFAAAYRREMSAPEKRRLLALLSALSHSASFSVGCYCEDPARCHRSVLAALLREQGATLAR
ncbi:MAG TPA: DUF488 family protein [Burkholderiales bacterium]|nr:DUF488 family protein [Burkholderiales bacterium]